MFTQSQVQGSPGIQMRLTTGPTSNMNTTFIVINKPLTDKHWGELGTKKSRKRYSKYQRSCRPVASDDGPGMLAKKMTCYRVTIKKWKKKNEKSHLKAHGSPLLHVMTSAVVLLTWPDYTHQWATHPPYLWSRHGLETVISWQCSIIAYGNCSLHSFTDTHTAKTDNVTVKGNLYGCKLL